MRDPGDLRLTRVYAGSYTNSNCLLQPNSSLTVTANAWFGGAFSNTPFFSGWEMKVVFESAPLNEVFAVHVEDQFGNHKVFEFVHTGSPKT